MGMIGDETSVDDTSGLRSDANSFEFRLEHASVFKISTAQSTELEMGSEKCSLEANRTYVSSTPPEWAGEHVIVELDMSQTSCDFSIGFVYAPHVSTPLPQRPRPQLCHANIGERECALLSTIAYAEGTRERYDIIFSFQTFSSFADHPRRLVCSSGYCSDAAGRYQFLSTTWDAVARQVGATTFAPEYQDLAALRLIYNRGVTNVDSIDTYGEFVDAMYRLNLEWASLPGSPYGQPTHSAGALWNKYREFGGV